MLFNSGTFIFFFLPFVFLLFLMVRRFGRSITIGLLVLSSLFFYAWTEPSWVLILIVSIFANFLMARLIRQTHSKMLVGLTVVGNLAVLGYYKYTNFFIDTAAPLFGATPIPLEIVLPIGISFFTFQQIAYVVDSLKDRTHGHDFLSYCLFVSFFPQLIAGPIVHHEDVIPQTKGKQGLRPTGLDIQIGITLFVFGLFKKLVLADNIAIFATPVFDAAAGGYAPTFFEAWGAALAYTFQIYFDFSGYSDMAIGLARMFGIRLPENFNAPYKATNIAEFWQRWHMTLSRFLRDYLYIPLGGNRQGVARTFSNLMTVMILGGLWHGAGWGFVVWGGLHGAYLCIHRLWSGQLTPWLGRILTFLAVVVAWVFFRAETLEAALAISAGLIGQNGIVIDAAWAKDIGWFGDVLLGLGASFDGDRALLFMGWAQIKWFALLLWIVWFGPTTQDMMANYDPVLKITRLPPNKAPISLFVWSPSAQWALVTFVLFVLSIPHVFAPRPFLYFQF
tara:strand:- start:1495 stop:3009 length:1515 start_codon:yes stop_codon:yes gene_type:complete